MFTEREAFFTESTRYIVWNEWVINNINDLGIIHLSLEVDLIYYLLVLAISLILSTAICFTYKGIKNVVIEEKDNILAEVNSCTRHYLEKCLENDEFRKLIIKISVTVLISFSLIGAFLGSAMFGFLFGTLILTINLYDDLQKVHDS